MQPDTERDDNNNTGDLSQSPTRSDVYPFPIDAIVLAGTHQNPKRLIGGRNKAFLEVGERALVLYVIDALLGAESVGQVFVVGPAKELLEVLVGYSSRVRVIDQRGHDQIRIVESHGERPPRIQPDRHQQGIHQ